MCVCLWPLRKSEWQRWDAMRCDALLRFCAFCRRRCAFALLFLLVPVGAGKQHPCTLTHTPAPFGPIFARWMAFRACVLPPARVSACPLLASASASASASAFARLRGLVSEGKSRLQRTCNDGGPWPSLVTQSRLHSEREGWGLRHHSTDIGSRLLRHLAMARRGRGCVTRSGDSTDQWQRDKRENCPKGVRATAHSNTHARTHTHTGTRES